MKKINIAIDGPSAAGKSTISKRIAKTLNYVHLDTGAMYRCTAYKALNNDISLTDEAGVAAMLAVTDIVLNPDGSVFLDGADVSKAIREDSVSMAASNVSKLGRVRELLVDAQRRMAEAKGFVMDGRDIGTVVLKDAEVKIFLTASVESRALRRYKQNQETGMAMQTMEAIMQDIADRDYQDMHREVSPLTQAADAVVIDSSDLTIDEVVEKVLEQVKEKTKE